MSECSKWIVAAANLLFIALPAVAGLKDLRTDKLPQDKSVQKTYADVLTVEDMVRDWSQEWRFDTPRENVASLLKTSLSDLQKATAASPDNEELFLFTGLVAHYAYNVDVDGSYELAIGSLEKAQKLAPEDYRPVWFLGSLQCQTKLTMEGMNRFLAVEKRISWEQIPVTFWDDYISCAVITNMPAHALRAGGHIGKLKAPTSKYRDSLLDIARNRLKTPEPATTYSRDEAWTVMSKSSPPVFISFTCGLEFAARDDWRLNLFDVQKGQCVAQIQTGPHASKAGDITPNILVLARRVKPGETLVDFANTYMSNSPLKSTASRGCPSQECLTFESMKPGLYGPAGDGHAIITIFKRNSPEFPGILFEEPTALPPAEGDKVSYFRADERLTRFDGTLYYLVLLDSASSVLEEAESDYDVLLKSFKVE